MEVVQHGDPLVSRSICIGRFPPMGCGGTHLRSLRELGQIQLRGVKTKSGRLRIGYDVV
jgi:Ser-tRNA(Ala) deacylase AlaX